MSVDIKSGIAFGWQIDTNKYHEMMNCVNADDDDFICLDSYDDTLGFIFGQWVAVCPNSNSAIMLTTGTFNTIRDTQNWLNKLGDYEKSIASMGLPHYFLVSTTW